MVKVQLPCDRKECGYVTPYLVYEQAMQLFNQHVRVRHQQVPVSPAGATGGGVDTRDIMEKVTLAC